jgi:cell division protein FtsZ
MTGVEFISINTDAQALRRNKAGVQLQIGNSATKGLGAGGKWEVGREAALEDRERIAEMIDGADMLFIAAGMGGGTGTGAAPVVAEVAKDLGILAVAVVTKPFIFEGKRMRSAETGLKSLSEHVDSLIVIPNEKLIAVMGGQDQADRCVHRRQRRAAQRGVRHRRNHQQAGHDQRRLRRRENRDGRDRHGDDGFRRCQRRKPRP